MARLVQDQQLRVRQQRSCQSHPAGHASGELRSEDIQGLTDTQGGKQRQEFRSLFAVSADHPQVPPYRQVSAEPVLLEDGGDFRRPPGDDALVRLGKSQNNAKQCGLSPAGGGHDAGTAALGKGQGNMIQNLVFPVGFADVL